MNAQHRLTAEQKTYVARQMDLVSRSFALVVPTVEPPLNHYLAVAYLICRVVDNVEDCQGSFPWKRDRFHELGTLLRDPAESDVVLRAWDAYEWTGLTEDERALMGLRGGRPLWEIFGAIPEPSRAPIRDRALEMAAGMQAIEDRSRTDIMVRREGIRLPRTVEGYNLYCYYVAGTVGHMATDLVIQHYDLPDGAHARLDTLSEACGRGLQKTNIVKDFARDVRRGACYLPDEWMAPIERRPLALEGAPTAWTEHVLADVLSELRDATDYVLALPDSAHGYRQASLLSLFPAYQTLLLAARRHERLFTRRHELKISRLTMTRCVADARRYVRDDDAIVAYGRQVESDVAEALRVPEAPSAV